VPWTSCGGRLLILICVPVMDLNERFHLALPETIYETAGGYVFGMLGQVAQVGDEVRVEGGILRVVATHMSSSLSRRGGPRALPGPAERSPARVGPVPSCRTSAGDRGGALRIHLTLQVHGSVHGGEGQGPQGSSHLPGVQVYRGAPSPFPSLWCIFCRGW
jgi:hypothetical protein